MKKQTHTYDVHHITYRKKILCKLLTKTNDVITIEGDTPEQIYHKMVHQFPDGIKTTGIVFLCDETMQARKNFFTLMSLGLSTGYFSEVDFIRFDNENTDL